MNDIEEKDRAHLKPLRGRPRLYLVLLACLLLCWGIGQILRDQNRITSLFFFIPTPVCAAVLLLYAASIWRGGWRKTAAGTAIVAAAPLLFLLVVENRWIAGAEPDAEIAPVRLVHWNVGWGRGGWKDIYHQVAEQDPDFVLLSEVPDHMEPRMMADSFTRIFYTTAHASGWEDITFEALKISPMLILARGELSNGRWLLKRGTHKVYSVDWRFRGRTHTVFAVEMDASLFLRRDAFLHKIIRLVADHEPDIVVGDLNSPRRSQKLSDLPEGYAHAYDAAGAGWSYTWPFPVFLYAIDQCIIGPGVRPHAYELESSPTSDHRMQILDFSAVDG